MSSITSIRLSSDIDQPLESLAKRMDRSKNYLINQAIKEYLHKQAMEDARWTATLEAIESVNAGLSVDEDEVNTWLDSWGTGARTAPPKA